MDRQMDRIMGDQMDFTVRQKNNFMGRMGRMGHRLDRSGQCEAEGKQFGDRFDHNENHFQIHKPHHDNREILEFS